MAFNIAGRLLLKHRVLNSLDQRQLILSSKQFALCLSPTRMKTTTSKEEKASEHSGDADKSGKELDIARENPYAGLTLGQKGEG